MAKIYLWCTPAGHRFGRDDVLGYALAEDGRALAGHLSSNKSFSQHDMGLTSDWKHEVYKNAYPEGYEVVWLDDPESDGGFMKALELNRAMATEAAAEPSRQGGL